MADHAGGERVSAAGAGTKVPTEVLRRLERAGLLAEGRGRWCLTAAGSSEAMSILHRMAPVAELIAEAGGADPDEPTPER